LSWFRRSDRRDEVAFKDAPETHRNGKTFDLFGSDSVMRRRIRSFTGRPSRSTGCVWPIDAEVARRATVTLPLGDPLPVYVTYFTADVSEAGAVEFQGDIYGRDARMGDSNIPAPVDAD
jgi:hypothetical protein